MLGDRCFNGVMDIMPIRPAPPGAADGSPAGQATAYPLLPSKLSPPILPHIYVPRSRLIERINRGVRFPLVLVTGVAGCGKTTLGSAWVRSGTPSGSPAWLSLDEEDNQPGVFWSYVREAVCRLGLPAERVTAAQQPDRVDRSFLVSLVTALLAADNPVVLVLDRFEVISERAIGRTLDFVLQHAGSALHLVILGRSARAFPVHRYRLAGDAIEIGNDDLAFTSEETGKLLERHGLRLAQHDYATMHDYTDGWVSALRLFAAVARSANLPDSNWPGSTQHAVTDLLIAEVLDSQPPLIQELLLRSSIAEQIHPGLANRLTGRFDSEALLRDAAAANVFVEPLDSAPGWYRCQHLFRQALRTTLDIRRPGLAPRLHTEAAGWYAEQGQLTESIRHSALIGDWDAAATRLVGALRVGAVLAGPDAEALRTHLSGMRYHPGGAPAAVVTAVLALSQFDAAGAAAEVNRARELIDTVPRDRHIPVELGIALVEAVLGRYHGRGDLATYAAETAEKLWLQLAPERARARPELRLLLLANAGAAQAWAHDHTRARRTLREVIADCVRADTPVPMQDALAQLALLELADGNLNQAEARAGESADVAQRAGGCSVLRTGAADAVLAAVALERNALPDVAEHLNRALAANGADLDPATVLTTTLLRARLAAGRSDPRAALEILDGGDRMLAQREGFAAGAAPLVVARCFVHLAAGDPDTAARSLPDVPECAERSLLEARVLLHAGERARAARLLAQAKPDRPVAALIAWSLLSAQAAAADGAEDEATELVRGALSRARPGGFRRPFVEAGGWLRRLLRQHPQLVRENAWLVSGPGGPARRDSPRQDSLPVLEALTGRELEVLTCLSQAMSVGDIGRELYLSSNTVKTHLKSIYRKLAATGRSDAARRARELHLIS